MRGVFVKILLWFWAALVLVAVALELVITATTTPAEVRVQRFSDKVLAAEGREAVARLDRKGPAGVAHFLDGLERATRMHVVLLDADGREVAGRPVPPRAAAVAARALTTGRSAQHFPKPHRHWASGGSSTTGRPRRRCASRPCW